MHKVVLGSLADLFINLSAGWNGVALILPIGSRKFKELRKLRINWKILIFDLGLGIFSLVIAIFMRSLI